MSLADDIKRELKKESGKSRRFRDQLKRYRAFKADMARHGAVLSEDSYDIPLMGRVRRSTSSVKANTER